MINDQWDVNLQHAGPASEPLQTQSEAFPGTQAAAYGDLRAGSVTAPLAPWPSQRAARLATSANKSCGVGEGPENRRLAESVQNAVRAPKHTDKS